MSIASSERSTSSRRSHRYTGFPESFCGNRNTSLPHPDADLSPNACITQEDISVSRVVARHRHSLHHKHKRTVSHGYITPEMEQMYGEAAAAPASEPSRTDSRLATAPGNPAPGAHLGRPTSGGGDSFASASTADHEDAAPKPEYQRHSRLRLSSESGTSLQTKSSRRGFLGKLGIHRHHD